MLPFLLGAIVGLGTVAAEEPPMFFGDQETQPEGEQFRATVAIDSAPGSKRFQGVWLVREDGDRWLIDYRPHAHWKPFEGALVAVSGSRYMPEGQAVGAVHFRLHTMRIVEPSPDNHLVAIGPEMKRSGRFVTETGQRGSKRGGSTTTLFETGGMRYMLANLEEGFAGEGTATLRQVSLSPFVAHVMGPRVWVLAFETSSDPEKSSPSGE